MSHSPEQVDFVGPAESLDQAFGILSLHSGRTYLVAPKPEETDLRSPGGGSTAGSGVIFTRADSMPTLEALLEENQVAYAVLERPVEMPKENTPKTPSAAHQRVAWYRIGAAWALSASVCAVGCVLLLDAVSEDAVRANPYTAISIVLVGLVLLGTLATALREQD